MARRRIELQVGAAEEAEAVLRAAVNHTAFCRAQCVWLAARGQTDREIAQTLDWSLPRVRQILSRYRHRGAAALAAPGPGGRRHGLLTWEQEAALLNPYLSRISRGETPRTWRIRAAYERLVGHPVARSTLYRLLARHGWPSARSGST